MSGYTKSEWGPETAPIKTKNMHYKSSLYDLYTTYYKSSICVRIGGHHSLSLHGAALTLCSKLHLFHSIENRKSHRDSQLTMAIFFVSSELFL